MYSTEMGGESDLTATQLTATPGVSALTVGVVIAREPTDHPWQDFRWRPIEILIGKPELPIGHLISESADRTNYYAGSFPIEVHRKETSNYLVNLENEPPVVYIVMREKEDDDEGPLPIAVEMVTVSPFEAQDFLDSGEDLVEPIPMPEPLLAWLTGFVAEHHQEEVFIKRKRDKLDIRNEKFGQEPLERIRQRQRRQ